MQDGLGEVTITFVHLAVLSWHYPNHSVQISLFLFNRVFSGNETHDIEDVSTSVREQMH